MNTVLHLIYLFGAICYIIVPFDRSRVRAQWFRWIAWAIAAALLVLAADGIKKFQLLPNPLYTSILGFVLGLLFTLIVSGQLSGRKISANDRG